MSEGLSQGQSFEQVDADAVCEACGAVNEEGTLLCKQCGNNLRDQRARRIASGQAGDIAAFDDKVSHVRLLTGLLTVMGILLVLVVVINLGNIESNLIGIMEEDAQLNSVEDLQSARFERIFGELSDRLEQHGTTNAEREAALNNPILDSSYTGRYILLPPGALTPERVLAEAELELRGSRVFFVARSLNGGMETHGYATLEEVQGAERPVVHDSATVWTDAGETTGRGLADPRPAGGHLCVVAFGDSDAKKEYLAFRVR